MRPHHDWQLRTRTLYLGERTLLMGIVNITPDSFSDGGLYNTTQAATDHALRLLDEGADLIDLGGESTRPDATPVSAEDEQNRVLPVLQAILRARPATTISVDTYHAKTAQAALEHGAEIINDVSGLNWDSGMAATLARSPSGAILMHTHGTPQTWATQPPLAPNNVTPLVLAGLRETLAIAQAAGIPRQSIVLDPGFGFGKLGDNNFVLLAQLEKLQTLGRPLLIGLSRKRFLTAHLPAPADQDRLAATSAAHVAAILAGAHILRIHDVPAARTAAGVADLILRSK